MAIHGYYDYTEKVKESWGIYNDLEPKKVDNLIVKKRKIIQELLDDTDSYIIILN